MPGCRASFFTAQSLYANTTQGLQSIKQKDVNDWFSLVLNANCVDTLQVSNEILDHLAHVQAVCQKYGKQSNTAKDVQPVWISF